MQQLHEKLMDTIPATIYWHGLDGQILGCNQRQAEVMGLQSSDQLVGRYLGEFYSDDYSRYLDDIISKVLQTKAAYFGEEYTERDSQPCYTLSHKVPLTGAGGDVVGILGVSMDITELKIAQESLMKEKQKTVEALQARLSMLHNMQHDIRTPFNGILGLSTYLETVEEDPEKLKLLNMISISADRLVKYCTQIMQYVESEHQDGLNLEEVDVVAMVEALQAMVLPSAHFKSLEFDACIHASTPTSFVTDSYRLKGVLLNLMTNAIKFTKEGNVTLSVCMKTNPQGRCLEFVVSDTGVGIDPSRHDAIFMPFEKAEKTTTKPGDGFGLGLSIVRTYVDALGGSMGVDSQLGQGAAFTVWVPEGAFS